MAAYPFQPLSNQRLKQLCRIMKESKHNVNTHRLHKSVYPSRYNLSCYGSNQQSTNKKSVKIKDLK